jgi:hypothetical protein
VHARVGRWKVLPLACRTQLMNHRSSCILLSCARRVEAPSCALCTCSVAQLAEVKLLAYAHAHAWRQGLAFRGSKPHLCTRLSARTHASKHANAETPANDAVLLCFATWKPVPPPVEPDSSQRLSLSVPSSKPEVHP